MNQHKFRTCAAAVAAAALSWAGPGAAEDIDIYAGTDAGGGQPNVLFFIDNTSNWSANNQAWKKTDVLAKCAGDTVCQGYVTQVFGSAQDLKQGQVELRALKLVLNEMVCNAESDMKVNAGLMMLNDAGTADGPSGRAGYIRQAIQPLESTYCSVFTGDLDNIDQKITTPDFKGPSSGEYGAALYEAFKYFGGWTNPDGVLTQTAGAPVGATGFGPVRYSNKINQEDSKAFQDPSTRTTYKSPIGEGYCGNNYIVLIGNLWPNQEWGADVNATPNPKLTQFNRLSYNAGPQLTPFTQKSSIRFADEWAKFLYETDVSVEPGQQNVRMFTVNVFNGQSDAKQVELLSSMAAQSGQGGYYEVNGNLKVLIESFRSIMTKIAAVNSIFASPSLPVSVNAQGTFLNQVFMGVFRPDGDMHQRWLGNLKQFRFALNGTALYLADSTIGTNGLPRPAVAQKSGFLDVCATSYWTSDSGTYWANLAPMDQASSCAAQYPGSAHSDRPDGPIVERGGAAQRLRQELATKFANGGTRNLQTCSDLTCQTGSAFNTKAFNTSNVSGISSTLVDWLTGKNTGDGYVSDAADGDIAWNTYGLATTTVRPTVHGDVVHSRPLAINYGTGDNIDVVVYYGSGDGTLRAINGNQGATDGNEMWAFIAPEHWMPPEGGGDSPLERVRINKPLVSYPNVPDTLLPKPKPRTWFFDGNIGGYQERTESTIDKVWIYPTMRRGGSAVYAFDVTQKPGTGSSLPVMLWKYSDKDNADMGQSWSTPVAIRVKGLSSPLIVFGAGYDNCEDEQNPSADACALVTKGKGIVVVDAQVGTAANHRFIGVGTGGLDASAGRFVADITPVDIDRDGYIDVLYAADTRGNLWRINTSDPANNFGALAVADWPVNKVATVADWTVESERRKFMYAPNVVALGTQVTVLIGSGDREKPFNDGEAAKVNNRFYGFRDDVTNTTAVTPIVGHGTVTGSSDITATTGGVTTKLKNVTEAVNLSPTELVNYNGWFRQLFNASQPYEQVVTTPLTLAGVTYFSTYRATNANTTCVNLGTGYGYQIDFQTGSKLSDKLTDYVDTFTTQGIPPSPVGGKVIVDGKTVPFCMGCKGDSVLDPTKITPKVKPDRKPVYRYQRIDKQ